MICGDDAARYPPLRGDDAGALAASTVASLAPAIGDIRGVGGGVTGAVLGGASAVAGVAGTIIADLADLAEGDRGGPVLRFLTNEEAAVAKQDKVTRFSLSNTVRSSAAAFRDYDPDRPAVRLQSAAVSTHPFPPSPFEIAAAAAAAAENVITAAQSVVPGAVGALGAVGSAVSTIDAAANQVGAALGQKVPFEVYEHHSPFLFPKWAFGSDEAPRILRQKRRRASVAAGEGGCSDLCPGHRFSLEGHPAPQLDGSYLVVRVEHRGQTQPEDGKPWTVYWNRFECAPAEMTYVPARPRRESVQVSLTATVVGPPGEEIYVDARAQIKVQFHWDREGRRDAHSSCWIRTMQPWAGAGWGHQFIPRVGMEVVVVFEGGDPDKPMVLGTLYNGTHPPPFVLPAHKTRSGWRTQSSPGGGGNNELSFEDAAHNEQIYVHAQRDLDEVVERDHTLLVKRDEHLHVVGAQTSTVDGNRVEKVLGSAASAISGDETLTVAGSRLDVVSQSREARITEDLTTKIGRRERREVAGRSDLSIDGDYTVRTKGCHTTIVGRHDKKRSYVLRVEGTAQISTSETIELDAEKGLTLRCGKSFVKIGKDRVEIVAPSVSVRGEGAGFDASAGQLKVRAKKDALLSSETILLKTKDASLALQKDVDE